MDQVIAWLVCEGGMVGGRRVRGVGGGGSPSVSSMSPRGRKIVNFCFVLPCWLCCLQEKNVVYK